MTRIPRPMWLAWTGCLAAVACLALSGCDTWDHFQKPPNLSSPGTMGEIPPTARDEPTIAAANAPLAAGGDARLVVAAGIEDVLPRSPRPQRRRLLTVAVNLQEQAEFVNQTKLARTTANTASVRPRHIPRAVAAGLSSTGVGSPPPAPTARGQGDVKRSENVVVNVATTVVQVLPNKNLEIAGSQEIRLNNELRQLQIRGLVPPEDIGSDNTITSDQMAEARSPMAVAACRRICNGQAGVRT